MKFGNYIPQLDILRSLAIMAIMLFHVKLFAPGYLGVDVFFVISGFLFAHSLKKQTASYSPCEFAKKRIFRILPSMMAVCILTLALAIAFAPSNYTLGTARQSFADLLFWGNIYQDIAGGGYMDSNILANPLMHLWYLQVLVQITVVMCFLVLLKKCCKGLYLPTLIALYIASFIIFIHFRYEMCVASYLPAVTGLLHQLDSTLASVFGHYLFGNQDSGYLWTCGRYWMFLSGTVCYHAYANVSKTANFAIMLMWLLGLIIFLSTESPDLLSVAATCAFIQCGKSNTVQRVAEWRIFRYIGQYAFALYLTHWPVLSLSYTVASEYLSRHNSIIFAASALALTPALAYLLHHKVESKRVEAKKILCIWLLAVICSYSVCLCSGFECWKGTPRTKSTVWDSHLKFKPVPDHHPLMKDYPAQLNSFKNGNFAQQLVTSYLTLNFTHPYSRCLYFVGDNNCDTPTCILIGDSAMQMYKEGFHEFLQKQGVSGVLLCSYVCPFDDSTRIGPQWGRWDREKCEAFFEWMSHHPEIETVYLNQAWVFQQVNMQLDWNLKPTEPQDTTDFIYENFGTFAHKLKEMGKRVYVLTPSPSIPYYNNSFYRELDKARLSRNMETVHVPHVNLRDFQKNTKPIMLALNKLEEEGIISILRTERTLFENGVFIPFDENEDYMYDDVGHLSPAGARKALRGCEKELMESIK